MPELTLEQFRSLSRDDKKKYLIIKKASKQTFYLTTTSKIVVLVIGAVLMIIVVAMIFTILMPAPQQIINLAAGPDLPGEECQISRFGNPDGVAIELEYATNPAMAISNSTGMFDGLTPVIGGSYTMTYIIQKRIPAYTYQCLSPTVCDITMTMLPSMVTSSFALSSYLWAWYLGVRPTPSGLNNNQTVTMYYRNSPNPIPDVQPLTVDYGPISQEFTNINIKEWNTYSIQIEYDNARVIRTVKFGINGTTFEKVSFAPRYYRPSPYPLRIVEPVDSSGSSLDYPLAEDTQYRNLIVINEPVTDSQLARVQDGEAIDTVFNENLISYRYWPLGLNDISNDTFHEGLRNYGCVSGLWVTGNVIVI